VVLDKVFNVALGLDPEALALVRFKCTQQDAARAATQQCTSDWQYQKHSLISGSTRGGVWGKKREGKGREREEKRTEAGDDEATTRTARPR